MIVVAKAIIIQIMQVKCLCNWYRSRRYDHVEHQKENVSREYMLPGQCEFARPLSQISNSTNLVACLLQTSPEYPNLSHSKLYSFLILSLNATALYG